MASILFYSVCMLTHIKQMKFLFLFLAYFTLYKNIQFHSFCSTYGFILCMAQRHGFTYIFLFAVITGASLCAFAIVIKLQELWKCTYCFQKWTSFVLDIVPCMGQLGHAVYLFIL